MQIQENGFQYPAPGSPQEWYELGVVLRRREMFGEAVIRAVQERQAAQFLLIAAAVELRNVVDPGVMGGVLLRFGGVELDGSIRARLEALRRNLASAIV